MTDKKNPKDSKNRKREAAKQPGTVDFGTLVAAAAKANLRSGSLPIAGATPSESQPQPEPQPITDEQLAGQAPPANISDILVTSQVAWLFDPKNGVMPGGDPGKFNFDIALNQIAAIEGGLPKAITDQMEGFDPDWQNNEESHNQLIRATAQYINSIAGTVKGWEFAWAYREADPSYKGETFDTFKDQWGNSYYQYQAVMQIPDITPKVGLLAAVAGSQGIDLTTAADLYKTFQGAGFFQDFSVNKHDWMLMVKTGQDEVNPEGARMFKQLLRKFNDYKARFGDYTLAVIAVQDKALAEKLYNDPASLTPDEWRKARELKGTRQFESESAISGWKKTSDDWIDQMADTIGQPIPVDESALREAARTIAAAWNMGPLTDRQLADMVAQFAAEKRNSFLNTIVAPWSKNNQKLPTYASVPSEQQYSLEYLRSLPEYKRLFAHLPVGETESQYASRMSQEVQNFIGDQNPELARLGMITGEKKAVQQAALLSGATDESSRFQDHLARIAKTLRSMT